MAKSVNLGQQLDKVVEDLMRTGRYGSRSEVLRAGVRLLHERETRIDALEAALAAGLADADAGRTRDLDDFFDELDEELAEQPQAAAE